jgi:signal peptidase I
MRRRKSVWREWVEALCFSLLFFFGILKPFVVEGYRVPTGSMEETILPGEFLLAEKFTYGLRIPFTDNRLLALDRPSRGEIIVFRNPTEGPNLIKRCIAVGGDTVEIRNKQLFVNGTAISEPYKTLSDSQVIPAPHRFRLAHRDAYQQAWIDRRFQNLDWIRDNFGPVVVPPGNLFMMGDNRDNSADSRFWGPLDERLIKGRALITYMSWNPDRRSPAYQFWSRIRWERIGHLLLRIHS